MLKKLVLLTLLLAFSQGIHAQGTIPDGNYRLALIGSPSAETTQALLKVETKDGTQTASVLAVPPRSTVKLTSYKANGQEIVLTLSNGMTFTSHSAGSEKSILGSMATDTIAYRAKLAPTDQTEFAQPSDAIVRVKSPEAYGKAVSLNNRPMTLRIQAQNEKDAEKRKKIQDQLPAAQKEADEKVADLYREVIEKHSDQLAALDSASALLGMAQKAKVSRAEAEKLIGIIEKHAKPYGLPYTNYVLSRTGTTLLREKGLEALALKVIQSAYQSMPASWSASRQHPVVTAYLQALVANKNTSEAKVIEAKLAKMDADMDKEYLATVPPFKPVAFAGRKNTSANQVAVLELFTGAQCPPCVAADVAFDALEKAYDHKDLVLIQYHMHIPGPDPMTNPDTVARFNYYRKLFPNDMRGTPSTLFNGKPGAGSGGGMDRAQAKFEQYKEIIDPILEKSSQVKVNGTASRDGDKIDIHLDVYGVEVADQLKLKTIIVEETVKYVGSNRLRFHHQVVRAMPGGIEGVSIKDKNFKHQVSADISKLRSELNNYLDEFGKTRPFPSTNRPLDMKNLKVIALVQNQETGEIVQACQIDVTGKVAAK
ncbi:MAG: hypothetical protein JNJ77_09570 [Planctomycetia bacterium]|nr:hypothetical protein [Planctomycetia bacterium]